MFMLYKAGGGMSPTVFVLYMMLIEAKCWCVIALFKSESTWRAGYLLRQIRGFQAGSCAICLKKYLPRTKWESFYSCEKASAFHSTVVFFCWRCQAALFEHHRWQLHYPLHPFLRMGNTTAWGRGSPALVSDPNSPKSSLARLRAGRPSCASQRSMCLSEILLRLLAPAEVALQYLDLSHLPTARGRNPLFNR